MFELQFDHFLNTRIKVVLIFLFSIITISWCGQLNKEKIIIEKPAVTSGFFKISKPETESESPSYVMFNTIHTIKGNLKALEVGKSIVTMQEIENGRNNRGKMII